MHVCPGTLGQSALRVPACAEIATTELAEMGRVRATRVGARATVRPVSRAFTGQAVHLARAPTAFAPMGTSETAAVHATLDGRELTATRATQTTMACRVRRALRVLLETAMEA